MIFQKIKLYMQKFPTKLGLIQICGSLIRLYYFMHYPERIETD